MSIRHRWCTNAMILTLAVCSGFGQNPPGTGRITGAIQTASGTAIAKALVAIMVRPTKVGEPFPPFNAVVLTAADGTYRLDAVPAATYAVCPRPPDATLMAPWYLILGIAEQIELEAVD